MFSKHILSTDQSRELDVTGGGRLCRVQRFLQIDIVHIGCVLVFNRQNKNSSANYQKTLNVWFDATGSDETPSGGDGINYWIRWMDALDPLSQKWFASQGRHTHTCTRIHKHSTHTHTFNHNSDSLFPSHSLRLSFPGTFPPHKLSLFSLFL